MGDPASNNMLIEMLTVGERPLGIAITPDADFAYVVNFRDDNVQVIRTSDNTVIETVTVGDGPVGVAITPDGDFAYVTNQLSDNVSVIQTSDNSVIATVTVGERPAGVAITPDADFAYVTNFISDNVSVIRTSDNTVVETVTVGDGPGAVAIALLESPCTTTDLSDAIAALGPEGDGTLNKGQANALQKKVAQAVALSGRDKVDQAENVLKALRQQLAGLEAGGVLTADQADELSACTEDVIAGLEDAG